MEIFKLFYFFTNMGYKMFNSNYFQKGPCLTISCVVLVLCVAFFIWWFYFNYTNKNVTKTATKSNFILKAWLGGCLTCFVLTEIVFAIWSKAPNANIVTPIIGQHDCNILVFSLINGIVYYTLFFGIFSFAFKGMSKNASKIWFF